LSKAREDREAKIFSLFVLPTLRLHEHQSEWIGYVSY
jgi:hypothetical protein